MGEAALLHHPSDRRPALEPVSHVLGQVVLGRTLVVPVGRARLRVSEPVALDDVGRVDRLFLILFCSRLVAAVP